MGKRSNFERIERDFYPTPFEAVEPLIPHLPDKFTFAAPCAGNGILIEHLQKNGGEVTYAFDIEPQNDSIKKVDALSHGYSYCDYIITNPPWNRKILHPMIEHFVDQKPTWLLFDADWAHTKQSIPYIPLLKKIVSIGRVKWIPNSKATGKDNCCWYLFDSSDSQKTQFFGRT